MSLEPQITWLPLKSLDEEVLHDPDLTVTEQNLFHSLLDSAFMESLIGSENQKSTQSKESDHLEDMREEEIDLQPEQLPKPNPNWVLELKQMQGVYFKVCTFLRIDEIQQLQYINSRFLYQTRKVTLKWVLWDSNDSIFWETVSNFCNISRADEAQYSTFGINYDEESEHSRDLDRTFLLEDLEVIENNKLKLDRILRALTVNGLYFQGLNYIASAFLANHHQLNTYWYTRFILYKSGNFQNNLDRLEGLNRRLEGMIKYHLPNTFDHLERENLTIEYFAARWFIGMFSYDTPIELMLRLWKLIAVSDENILICFTLSVLKKLELRLLELEEQDMNRVLKNQLKSLITQLDTQEILQHTIDIYSKQFADLSFGFDELQLQENPRKNSLYSP